MNMAEEMWAEEEYSDLVGCWNPCSCNFSEGLVTGFHPHLTLPAFLFALKGRGRAGFLGWRSVLWPRALCLEGFQAWFNALLSPS